MVPSEFIYMSLLIYIHVITDLYTCHYHLKNAYWQATDTGDWTQYLWAGGHTPYSHSTILPNTLCTLILSTTCVHSVMWFLCSCVWKEVSLRWCVNIPSPPWHCPANSSSLTKVACAFILCVCVCVCVCVGDNRQLRAFSRKVTRSISNEML